MKNNIPNSLLLCGLLICLLGSISCGYRATLQPATLTLTKLPVAESTPHPSQTHVATNIPTAKPTATPEGVPAFRVEVVLENLDHPWDFVMLQDGSFFFTERGNKITYVVDGVRFALNAPEDTYVLGEGGLLGLALDPEFSDNHFLFACMDSKVGDRLDIRVIRWTFNLDNMTLQDRVDIVTGLPANPSGRHSGCQLEFGSDQYLWVGTGDTANGTVAQDPQSLGGKILRVDRDGNPAPGNLKDPYDPRIYSYGHRNVQGLAFFNPLKKSAAIGISVEQGSDRDDEVNSLTTGNFGWNPIPGYNEAVPMTDLTKYPDAVPAIWSSGFPTLATSGGTIIQGTRWGAWDQAVAIAALKGARIVVLELRDDLSIARETHILQGVYGRIRTIQQGTDGNLYVLTDNGGPK